MFEGIVNRAQTSVDTLVTKYVTRMAVTLPFLISIAFAIAAAVVKLSDVYGSLAAYCIIAAAFAGLGLLAALAIALLKPAPIETMAETEAEATAAESTATSEVTPELLLTVLGSLGPVAFPFLVRFLLRNLPLVLGVAILAYLLLSQKPTPDVVTSPEPA
jgi:hypothetical protein